VLSWLLLRGKCRDCATPISSRYPLVEAATALFFIIVTAAFVPTLALADGAAETISSLLVLVAFLYLAAISIALTLIDLDTHTLPNRIVLPAYLVLAPLLAGAGILAGNGSALISAAIGGGALFALYFAAAVLYAGGMGFGDVKLAGILGLSLGFLGWGPLVVGAFAAFFLGGLFGIVLILLRRAKKGTGIPFGPWMLAGAWIGIFWGDSLWTGYLQLVGLS
jgi:leader peptidase (prepilin peptidase)/N-methyltransferase